MLPDACVLLIVSRYELKLKKYLEDLIREMDRKIAKNKERAEKESAPRPLLPAEQDKLADFKQRAKRKQSSSAACVVDSLSCCRKQQALVMLYCPYCPCG